VTNLESFLAVDDALDPEEYRSREAEGEGSGELPSTESDLDAIVEALLFVADKPLKPGDLAERAHCAPEALRESILRLQEVYANRGIRLVAVAGGFAFRTAPEVAEYVREATAQKPVKLTRAQLETLAILAYRQPMTRPEIDDVRGVDSGPVLKLLLERHLECRCVVLDGHLALPARHLGSQLGEVLLDVVAEHRRPIIGVDTLLRLAEGPCHLPSKISIASFGLTHSAR
jgi:segregation and condensation protein B